METIKKCTEVMNNGVIEQTAYIQASVQKKDLDLQAFKDDIRKELNNAGAKKTGEIW